MIRVRPVATACIGLLLTFGLAGCFPREQRAQKVNQVRADRLNSAPAGFTRLMTEPSCSINLDCNDPAVNVFYGGANLSVEAACQSVLTWAIEIGQTKYIESPPEVLSTLKDSSFSAPLNSDTLADAVRHCTGSTSTNASIGPMLAVTGTRIAATERTQKDRTLAIVALQQTPDYWLAQYGPWRVQVRFTK